MKKFLFASIGIVLVLIVFFVIGHYFLSKQNQNSFVDHVSVSDTTIRPDWKLYKNDAYGFQIQYPTGYQKFDDACSFSYVDGFCFAFAPRWEDFLQSTSTYKNCWDYVSDDGHFPPNRNLYEGTFSGCRVTVLVHTVSEPLSLIDFLIKDYADPYKKISNKQYDEMLNAIKKVHVVRSGDIEFASSEGSFFLGAGSYGGDDPAFGEGDQKIIKNGDTVFFITNQLPKDEKSKKLFEDIYSTFRFTR